MARPTKFTAKRRQSFLDALLLAPFITVAAREAGVSPSTVRSHMRDDKQFQGAVQDARREGLDKFAHDTWMETRTNGSLEQKLKMLSLTHPQFNAKSEHILHLKKGRRKFQ